jgi:alanine dehydrogenase
MTLILSNEEVDAALGMSECIATLEDAYRELGEGRGVNRQRSDSLAPTARADALYSLKSMDGIAPKLGVGAVRINSDIVTWPRDGGNLRREKIPAAPGNRWVGLVLLFSTETGEPLAIFPDGYLQRLRVGAANGLGTQYLARADAETAGLLGSGWQAGTQVTALLAVRPGIRRVRCYSPNPERRRAFARAMSAESGIEIVPVESPEEAVKGADVVLCATNTLEHIFRADWLEPGMHVSSIKKPEVEPAALKRADRLVIHAHDAAPTHVAPEGVATPERTAGKGWSLIRELDFDALPTLPDLILGKTPGRESAEQITCFLNNIGLGYQFAAAGAIVYRNARARGLGRELPTDWFTEDVHP